MQEAKIKRSSSEKAYEDLTKYCEQIRDLELDEYNEKVLSFAQKS